MSADPVELDPPFGDQATDEPRGSVLRRSAAWFTVSSGGAKLSFGRAIMPPSRLPKDQDQDSWQACVWLRPVRLAIGRGRRRHAAAAARVPCDPGRWARRIPRRTGPGQLPKHRACSAASPAGRRGGRPASCRTTCGRPGPGARCSRGDRHRTPGHAARTGQISSAHSSASRIRTPSRLFLGPSLIAAGRRRSQCT
jgi:hypothetical protein